MASSVAGKRDQGDSGRHRVAGGASGSVTTLRVDHQHPIRPAAVAAWARAYSWCMTSADQAEATIGGACTGSSPMISVASVLPPRIMPP